MGCTLEVWDMAAESVGHGAQVHGEQGTWQLGIVTGLAVRSRPTGVVGN